MKGKLIHAIASLAVFAGLSVVLLGLTWQPHVHADTTGGHEGHDACCPPTAGHAVEAGKHDHEQAENNKAAGAVSLDELRQRHCEHEMAIIDCDECRYEAGVAKISPQTAQGLVETWPVRMESQTIRRLPLTGEVQLDPTRVAQIASAGAGRVEEVRKHLGEKVEPGDIVAVVQSPQFGEAQAAFFEARARLDLARRTFDRERQLHESKISSQADYLAARGELASAEASVAAARKRLQLFGWSGERIESLILTDPDASFGQLALTSPLGGVVVEQNAVQGQLVETTDTLYRVADLSRVWVWCDVYEADLAALHERIASGIGVPAQVRSGAFPQTVFHGTLDLIGSQLDRQTRTVKVRVVVDNSEGRLKPGMFVRIVVGLEDNREVLRVPATAVLSDAGQTFVFAKLTDDLWIRRDVTIGPAQDGVVEVQAGLSDGDVVAFRGAFMFKSEILKEKMGAGCAH
ncbi:MAG: efflux RND transporter periplasmic adaptor subunit [Phycisphaerae bacterium]|nr:efflux RND transporter periplasmic adaptor subunit [Phycisphaerae bacterium]HON90561.1 efflux RND transporter periplasmic adaptor subunit [Sedimentisphaerales bacterium]